MTLDILIINASVVIPETGIINTNIGIKDSKIHEFTTDEPDASRKINANGMFVIPGVIDPHVHYGVFEPIERAAIHESRSAAIGGVTTMMRMLRLYGSYREKLEKHLEASARSHIIDYAYHASILLPQNLLEIDHCLEKGITSFKLYMNLREDLGLGKIYMDMDPYTDNTIEGSVNTDDHLIRSTLTIAGRYGCVAIVHAEDPEICAAEIARLKERNDLAAWSEARPPRSEQASIKYLSEIAREHGCKLYLPHIGSSQGIDAASDAKKKGQVLIETCPHYLTHTTDFDIRAKVVPPLRSKHDQAKIWKALKHNVIDCVGSDHVANRLEMKGNDLWSAFAGFPGIATLLPVLLSEGVNKDRISLERLVEVTSTNAAKIFGIYPSKGTLSIGSDADLVIIDLNREQKVTPELLQSYSDYTIYDGMIMKGWPILTMVRGNVVMEYGEVTGKAGYGKYIRREIERDTN